MSVQYDPAGVGDRVGMLSCRSVGFPPARRDAGLSDVGRASNQTHRQRKFSSKVLPRGGCMGWL